jgi:hypothetical protein
MSRKYHDGDFWYEITTAPDAGGRVTRAYRITCRYCNCLKTFRCAHLSEEKIRKQLIRDGWEIGRNTTSHSCPGCNQKPHRDKPQPVPVQKEEVVITPPPSSLEYLEMAWAACSEPERETFALKIYEEYFSRQKFNGEPARTITDDNEEAPVDDGDDTPADWWIEIHGGANSEATK